jgi:hypothetical protein
VLPELSKIRFIQLRRYRHNLIALEPFQPSKRPRLLALHDTSDFALQSFSKDAFHIIQSLEQEQALDQNLRCQNGV